MQSLQKYCCDVFLPVCLLPCSFSPCDSYTRFGSMLRTFVLDFLGVTGVCNMLLGVLCALGNIHNMGRMLGGQNVFFGGHYVF
jgi:hypothetical protein